jgi:hypothetical protein
VVVVAVEIDVVPMQNVIELDLSGASPSQIADACVKQFGDAKFVRVDGHSFTGKTRLAEALASNHSFTHVGIDGFFLPNLPDKIVVTRLNRPAFHQTVRAALTKGPTVVEGVCLEDVLPEALFPGGFRIYLCSRITDSYTASEDAVDKEELGTDTYHQRFRPMSRAHLIVQVGQLHF